MRRYRRLLGWLALALLVGGLAGIVARGVRRPDTLTRERLEAARAAWHARRVGTYSLEIEVGGPTGQRNVIEVRDGEVVGMTSGGVEATRSAWHYWSVDGLFDMLSTELSNAKEPGRTYGPGAGEVVLRARFDPENGVPLYFLRHVMGTRHGVEWEVVRFEQGHDASGGG